VIRSVILKEDYRPMYTVLGWSRTGCCAPDEVVATGDQRKLHNGELDDVRSGKM
jgi:hypothetical protein